MIKINNIPRWFWVSTFIMVMITSTIWAQEKYEISVEEWEKYKKPIDDPSPFYKNIEGYRKIIPPNIYSKLTYDVDKMKNLWAEIVGFKSPEVVGKIAPEIKPGFYTYKDKDKYPFEKIMWKHMYDRFNPTPTSGPRLIGNFTEIEVVPTRQYYWALPVAEATKKYMGTVKQDEKGYIIADSYIAGYPFPRPSGRHMAQQIIYNWEKQYCFLDSAYYIEHVFGFSKNLRNDHEGINLAYGLRLSSRVAIEPLGFIDQRAKDQKEHKVYYLWSLSPRDLFGNIYSITTYTDPNRFDLFLAYINTLRRIRKLSSTDTQDPTLGQDLIYDDWFLFNQKISPTRYPYKYEVIGEQEYLAPITWDGSPYLSTKEGCILKKLQFERRPCWVVQMTQLDPTYVYSKRIWYIDKETLLPYTILNYDQKGRLYRSYVVTWAFLPEMGIYNIAQNINLDHLDIHSTFYPSYHYPAVWLKRGDVSMSGLIKAK